jgi:hypothetical protein
MRVRHRILLAALAVGVVVAVVVLTLPAGHKDNTPKLSFTLGGYTNNIPANDGSTPKIAIVKFTNLSTGPLILKGYDVIFEREHFGERVGASPPGVELDPGNSATVSVLVCLYDRPGGKPPFGSNTESWRLVCVLERRTLANKVRAKLLRLPLIGRRIAPPVHYSITSEWFAP